MLVNAATAGGAAMAAGQCVAGKCGAGEDEAWAGRSGLGFGIDSDGMLNLGSGSGSGSGSAPVPLKQSALPGYFAAVVYWLRHSTSS